MVRREARLTPVSVRLLEYDNIEGMILLSELSRRRIRSIGKLIRIGRNEVVMCMRVDEDKGYLDLSKRRVPPDELADLEARFNSSRPCTPSCTTWL